MTQKTLAPLLGMRILFADDDDDTADSMAAILGTYFQAVLVAADGEQALSFYQRAAPDVVLLDIDMPSPNGLEVARRIREADRDIPIGILTCHDGRDTLMSVIPLGLADYLMKPVSTATLQGFLERSVAQLEQRGRLRLRLASGVDYHPQEEKIVGPEGEISLTANERNFLRYMLARRGKVVECERLCRQLAGPTGDELSIQALRNLVHRLRGKIGRDAILSHKDLGYRLP